MYYLFFAEKPVQEKLLYFDANTSLITIYLLPISLGIAISVGMPWLKFSGAWIAKLPSRYLHELQDSEARERRINELTGKAHEETAVANFEAASEQRKIDAAKRLEDAKSVDSDDLERDIIESRKGISAVQLDSITDVTRILSETEIFLLKNAAIDRHGMIRIMRFKGGEDFRAGKMNIEHNGSRLERAKIEADILRLQEYGLIEDIGDKRELFQMTDAGFLVVKNSKN